MYRLELLRCKSVYLPDLQTAVTARALRDKVELNVGPVDSLLNELGRYETKALK